MHCGVEVTESSTNKQHHLSALLIFQSTLVLLEDVLICEVNLPVEVLKAGSLAEAHKLVVDEAILDVVELVDVLHNFLTLFLYRVLDKRVSANVNPKANVTVIYKGLGGEQGTEVCEGGISSEQALCGRVRLGR